MTKKKSFQSLGGDHYWEKTKLIRSIMNRRFSKAEEADYLFPYIDEYHIDDILNDMLMWDAAFRKRRSEE
jgi:hypothetical protein